MYFFYKPNVSENINTELNKIANYNIICRFRYINNLKYNGKTLETITLLNIVFKNNKIIWLLKKFLFKLKLKINKKKYSINKFDLYYNEIDENDNILELYHLNKKWKFTYIDITNICINNLTNCSEYLELCIKYPRNPYNFVEFEIQHIAVIYNFLHKYNNIPIIIQLFKNSNYNIYNFSYIHFKFINNYIYTKHLISCNCYEIYIILTKFTDIYYINADNINYIKLYNNISNYKESIINIILKVARYSTYTVNDKHDIMDNFFVQYPILLYKRTRINYSSEEN
jgi:hypothetical protein